MFCLSLKILLNLILNNTIYKNYFNICEKYLSLCKIIGFSCDNIDIDLYLYIKKIDVLNDIKLR